MGNRNKSGSGRLYGGVIAIITGAYSFLIGMLSTYFEFEPVLIVLGFLVGIHGAVMVTPLADRYTRLNGILMMGFGALMIAYQAWMGITTPMGRSLGQQLGAWVNPGYDMGMVALALILFLAGVITFFSEDA
jgi:hypothetical protein